jgi:hypothetical protein
MVSATDELSRVFLENYEARRIVIQRLIESGAMPCFGDQEWMDARPLAAATVKPDVFYFKDNKAAFECACAWMDCSIQNAK